MQSGVVSIGYEGRTIGQFVDELVRAGTDTVADVRLNAISRKTGFSKNGLRDALAEVGISYIHFRSLGNPKSNREPFWAGHIEEGCETFRNLLTEDEAASAMAELRLLAASQTVAVLCFEHDEERCHRQVVIEELGDLPNREPTQRPSDS